MTRARLGFLILAALAAIAMPARSAPLEELDPGAVAVFIAAEPEKPVAGEAVTFYAVFKGTPLPGTVVAWSFSHEKAVGNPVRHVFEEGGPKPVEVHAWQPGSKPLTDAIVLDVADPNGGPPEGAVEVFFEVASKVQTNEPVTFIAVFKGTPMEGAVVRWDFGPRESAVYGNPVRHVFLEAGKRLVAVTLEQPGLKEISYTGYVLVFPQRVERKWR